MSSFPNLPPASPSLPNQGPGTTGLHTIDPSPAAAAPTPAPEAPASEAQPPQMPFLHSANDGLDEQSEAQFLHDYMKESHALPLGVLAICIPASLVIYGLIGMSAETATGEVAGVAGAIGLAFLAGVMLLVSAVISVAAGWITCKLSSEDYGSIGGLLLRFSAVAAAQVAVFGVIMGIMGPIVAFFAGIPILFAIVMFVAGLSFLRTLLFNVVSNMIFWGLISFFMMSIAAAAA